MCVQFSCLSCFSEKILGLPYVAVCVCFRAAVPEIDYRYICTGTETLITLLQLYRASYSLSLLTKQTVDFFSDVIVRVHYINDRSRAERLGGLSPAILAILPLL